MKTMIRRLCLSVLLVVPAMYAGPVENIRQFIAEYPDSLILLYRPGCPYCKYVLPLFDAVQSKYGGKGIGFLKVDIAGADALLKVVFGFSTVPTFIYFKDGQERNRHGSNDKRLTQKDIEAIIQNLYF